MNQNLLVILIQQHLLVLLKELCSQPRRKLLDYYEDAQQNAHHVYMDLHTSTPKLATVVVGDIRKEIFQSAKETMTIHRVFLAFSSEIKYEVGWVLNEDVAVCMICCRYFYRLSEQFATKHHCRACGNIVCDHCSASVAVVAGLEAFGEQRVCLSCDYGQSLVEAPPNNRNGVSLVHLSDTSIISDSSDKEESHRESPLPEEEPIMDIAQESLDSLTEADRIYQEKVDFLHNFVRPEEKATIEHTSSSTATTFTSLPLADYGPLDLFTVTPYIVLKCFYRQKPAEDGVSGIGTIGSHSMQNARRLFTAVQDLLQDIDLSKSSNNNTFVYVNVCTSEMVPFDTQRFSYQKSKNTWISEELYPMVFNPLAEKYQGISVFDLAINPGYVSADDTQKMACFEEQLLNGLSLLFPRVEFTRCEAVTCNSSQMKTESHPDTSGLISPRHLNKQQAMMTKRRLSMYSKKKQKQLRDSLKENDASTDNLDLEVGKHHQEEEEVRMILPTEEAMLAFRYTYASMTSLILQTTQSYQKEQLAANIDPLLKLQKEFTSNLVKLLTYRKEQVVNAEKARLLLQELHPQQQQPPQQKPSSPTKVVTFATELMTFERVKPSPSKLPASPSAATTTNQQTEEKSSEKEMLDPEKNTNHDDDGTTNNQTRNEAKRVLPRRVSSLSVQSNRLIRSPSNTSLTSSLDLSIDASTMISAESSSSSSGRAVISYSPTSWEMMKQSLQRRRPSSGMVVPRLSISPTNGAHKINLAQHLTATHYTYIPELRIDSLTAERLKDRAKKDPELLIGWQILIFKEKDVLKGLYVVTNAAVYRIYGTMFRVSQVDGKERWLKLGFHEATKKRFSFQLQRQVMTKQEILALQKF